MINEHKYWGEQENVTMTGNKKERVKTTHRNNNERVMLSFSYCQPNRFIKAPSKAIEHSYWKIKTKAYESQDDAIWWIYWHNRTRPYTQPPNNID